MRNDHPPFWAYEHARQYALLAAIVVGVLFAVFASLGGGDFAVITITFGIGIYLGCLLAMRDGYKGPR